MVTSPTRVWEGENNFGFYCTELLSGKAQPSGTFRVQRVRRLVYRSHNLEVRVEIAQACIDYTTKQDLNNGKVRAGFTLVQQHCQSDRLLRLVLPGVSDVIVMFTTAEPPC